MRSKYHNSRKTCALCVKYNGNRGILERDVYSYYLNTEAEGRCLVRGNMRVKAWVGACSQFKPIPEFDF